MELTPAPHSPQAPLPQRHRADADLPGRDNCTLCDVERVATAGLLPAPPARLHWCGIDFGDQASPIMTAAESPRGGVPNPGSAAHNATPRSVRPRRMASFPSHCTAISRRVQPRCTTAVVEWAMDPTTTPQPDAGPDVQIMDVPQRRRNEPGALEAAAAASYRVAVEPQIDVAARPQNGRLRRARHAHEARLTRFRLR
eukprot:366472-Chlamydomonas_euryale.AAC.10